MTSPGAAPMRDRLETACSPAPPAERAAWAGAGGGGSRAVVAGGRLAGEAGVAQLGQHRRRAAGLAVRRAAHGRRLREQVVRAERLALDRPDGVQVVAKRHRRARSDAELDPVPVLARGVVDDRPPLHVHLAGLVHHQPVARLPGRRLGNVGELQPVCRGARKADLHVDEGRAPLARARGRVGDGRGLTGVGVDHRQRSQKVIDPLGGDGEPQGIAFDRGRAFEVGDPVSVDHDTPEHRVGGADIARSGAPTSSSAEREHAGGYQCSWSHVVSSCRIPLSDGTHAT